MEHLKPKGQEDIAELRDKISADMSSEEKAQKQRELAKNLEGLEKGGNMNDEANLSGIGKVRLCSIGSTLKQHINEKFEAFNTDDKTGYGEVIETEVALQEHVSKCKRCLPVGKGKTGSEVISSKN